MDKARILIISPATAQANNGNWRTAQRWAGFLKERYHVDIDSDWDDASAPPDLMIALHARRSAAPLAAFAASGRPAILVLTGTDLYRDIRHDDAARRSLQLAARLVVLQEAGLEALPAALRPRASVIYQSAPALPAPAPATEDGSFPIVMIGHLREEKDPRTYMRAAELASAPQLRFLQIGGELDPALAAEARATAARLAQYRWTGALPHRDALEALRRSRLLALPSRMEGGAHVIIEAVSCGVPVAASAVPGNLGMLGRDYAGYFPAGDAAALARLMDRAAADAGFYQHLRMQCAARLPLFAPERERSAVLRLADNALPQTGNHDDPE